ncbi:MAG TPA: DUF5336 domain-containing protein [Pseudonocardia sp.]
MTQQPQEPPEASDRASGAPVGPLRPLALTGAGLALVFYLLGFVSDVGTTGLVGALVIGGGLLAGTAALPSVGRVLAPAAVVAAVGTLGLLQVVVSSRAGGLLIGALVVALLETAVVAGALLIDARVVGGAAKRATRQVDHTATPPPDWSPDHAWLGQHPDPPETASIRPTRGAAPSDLTMTYSSPPGAGPQQYGAPLDNTALIGTPTPAPVARALPGPSGGAPAFGQAAAGTPGAATEVVPMYGLAAAGVAERGPSGSAHAAPADAPVHGTSGAQAINGASVAELGQPNSPYNTAVDGQAQVFGLSQQSDSATERGQPGQAHGGPGTASGYGVAGAPSPGVVNGRTSASGPSHAAPDEEAAPQFRAAGAGAGAQRAPAGPTPGAAPLYGLSAPAAHGPSNAGPAGSGPAHAAPTGSTPVPAAYGLSATAAPTLSGSHHAGQGAAGDVGLAVRGSIVPGSSGPVSSGLGSSGPQSSGPGSSVPGPRSAPTSSGAHAAAGDAPGYGGPTQANGARVHRGGPTAAGDAAPVYGRSGSGGPGGPAPSGSGSGSHHAPTPGVRGDAAPSPRPGTAPVGREVSGETAIPMYGLPGSSSPGARSDSPSRADRGRSDTTSDTTAFRAHPTGTASDATPAFGHAPTEGGDVTIMAPPGRPGAANGSAPPAAPTPESTTPSAPSGRHGSRRKGRHGQPDEAPDSTRVFRPER